MKHVQERALLIEAMLVEFFICLGVMICSGFWKQEKSLLAMNFQVENS